MTVAPLPALAPEIIYPESDGQPMAQNTEQYEWIVVIKENLDLLFRRDPDVFVASDLFWYPVQGDPDTCRAPDALVAFGRPKGKRRSYKQWEEAHIAPQVVVEILSPSNTPQDLDDLFDFYETHGAEEYYSYDPETNELLGWQRKLGRLWTIRQMDGWVSPRLGIRFDLSGEELRIYRPDGQRFLTFEELADRAEQAEQERDAERSTRQQMEQERNTERTARQQAEFRVVQMEQERDAERSARQRIEAQVEQLATRLRDLETRLGGADTPPPAPPTNGG